MEKFLIIFAILVLALRLPGQTTKTTRVALMDFVSDDNSYRSTVAVEDLMSALQTDISKDTNYDWVERAELGKAVKEFKLAGFGLIDRSEAIRSGRWVKADWGIYGNISTNFNSKRTLSLEIVNLQRADVLVETNLSLLTPDSGPFQMKSEYVPEITSTLKALLNQARTIYMDSEKKDAVAFLFLSLSQSGSDDAYGDLADNFRSLLYTESTNGQRFHLVQFQRADAALDEANLVLSGLAESDSNSWEKVADHYVWGDARVNDQKMFDEQTMGWRDERIMTVKLNVWDGRGEPRIIDLVATNLTSVAVARKLTQAIEPLLRQDKLKPIVENVRGRISDSIFALYAGLPFNFSFNSPAGRRQWFAAVQLLETVCFFNPGNAAAREQLLRIRWGTALAGSDAGKIAAHTAHVKLDRLILAGELESSSRNKFFFVRRRSEAWEKYVEQFDFKSALANPDPPGIAAEYVLSAWLPFEMFSYAQESQAQWGVPRDAGLHELTEWQNQFGSEFVSRLLKVPDQYNEAFHYALQSYYREIDQSGGEQQLLAQLKVANVGKKSEPTNSQPLPRSVRLPRVAEFGFVPATDIFYVRSMMFPPLLVEPDIKKISFPSGVRVKGVKAMVFFDDTLWLAVEIAEPLEIKTVNGQIEKEFQPVSEDHVRLWKLNANAQKLESVTGPLAANDINSMAFHGDILRLVLNDNEMATLNVKTGDLRRHELSDNGISTNQFALADVSREIIAIAGPSLLDRIGRIRSVANDRSGTLWIASDSGLHGVNPNTKTIRSQWSPISPTVPAVERTTHFGQVRPPKTDSQLVKEVRQKLELRRQMLETREIDANQPNLFVSNSRLYTGILSVTPDDDYLWVFTRETTRPLLYHSASRSWVGGFSINRMGTPSILACGGGKLWLATRIGENFSILKIDTGALKSMSNERWLPDIISQEELATQIFSLSEHERSVYFFFSGNDAAAVQSLQTQAEDKLDAESLFLLHSCFGEMGKLNLASHVKQTLMQKYPDSVFSRVLTLDQGNKEKRATIENRFKAQPALSRTNMPIHKKQQTTQP